MIQILRKYIQAEPIFIASLFVFAVALPTSFFLISVAQFGLAIAWFLKKDYKHSFQKFIQNKQALLVSSIFLLHVLGLFWTNNFDYAFHDLKIKLPLLIIPFTCAAFSGELKNRLDQVLLVFILSTAVSTLISECIILGYSPLHITDVRQSFIFISHIRLSLMMVMSIGFVTYMWRENKFNQNIRILLLILSAWMILFMFIAELGTGLFIGALLLCFFGLKALIRAQNKTNSLLVFTFGLATVIASSVYINQRYEEFSHKNSINFRALDKYTPSHRNYFNDTLRKETENGNYIWVYQSWEECRNEWMKRSKIHPDSNDLRGQVLKHTLFRYMASKGLRKDSVGIHKLSNDDIRNIENGVTNYKFVNGGISKRLNDFFYEYNNFKNNESANGHSVYMRLEFWKTAWHIILQHPIIGTGTGDVNDAFINQYAVDHSHLEREYWLRSHNQFLTFAVTFGVLGILFLFYVFYTLIKENQKFYFSIFSATMLLSFLNEDSLETSTGAVLFAFVASLLTIVFAKQKA